jgi:hypothetical protein
LQDNHQTVLHEAVLCNNPELVRYFILCGVNINIKDKVDGAPYCILQPLTFMCNVLQDGLTAAALAYQGGNTEIIDILLSAKAQEFAGSPYSPYALSFASGMTSVRSGLNDVEARTPAAQARDVRTPQTGKTPLPTVSPLSNSDWRSPRARAFSVEIPGNIANHRFTFNSPASGYRRDSVVATPGLLRSPPPAPDSVRRRMTLVSESLEAVAERQRSFSLPASSPIFDAARECSPVAPLLLLPHAYSADNTPREGEGSSPRSTLTGGEASASSFSRPPLGKHKTRKPIASRLRKAAGKAMALIVPARGVPPRPTAQAAVHTRSVSSGTTTVAEDSLTEDVCINESALGRTEHAEGIAMKEH